MFDTPTNDAIILCILDSEERKYEDRLSMTRADLASTLDDVARLRAEEKTYQERLDAIQAHRSRFDGFTGFSKPQEKED